jgi:hypothetical protein
MIFCFNYKISNNNNQQKTKIMNWGNYIVASFIAFGLFIGYMAVVSFQQSVDLVAEDYYQQEIAYQDHIDKVDNTENLEVKVGVHQENGQLSIRFPQAMQTIQGQIVLFRPSDATLDRNYEIRVNEGLEQTIPTVDLAKGMYKLKVDWTNGTKDFYSEETIFIR